MKKSFILVALCFVFCAANAQAPANMDVFDGCGMEGTAKGVNLKKLNQLKNRYTAPQDSEVAILPSLTNVPGHR